MGVEFEGWFACTLLHNVILAVASPHRGLRVCVCENGAVLTRQHIHTMNTRLDLSGRFSNVIHWLCDTVRLWYDVYACCGAIYTVSGGHVPYCCIKYSYRRANTHFRNAKNAQNDFWVIHFIIRYCYANVSVAGCWCAHSQAIWHYVATAGARNDTNSSMQTSVSIQYTPIGKQ